MVDREQSNTSKRDTISSRREQGFRVERVQGADQKQQPVVGRNIPDESKERHNEIAVEAGRMAGRAHKRDEKR
jgi:hypothetical protein